MLKIVISLNYFFSLSKTIKGVLKKIMNHYIMHMIMPTANAICIY